MEIRRFEERMENLREELRKERDKSQKKTTKDLVEVGAVLITHPFNYI